MFVKRCGFYIEDKRIVRKDVWVEWDMDMRKEDRYLYIGKIKSLLTECPTPIIDTTTASPNYLGKKLSAYWNKVEGMNCIEAYDVFVKQYDEDKKVPGVFEYIYYLALTESSLNFIKTVNTFSNMFFNPDKQSSCEALACCALKLLIQQNKFDYIMDLNKLCYWCWGNIGTMKIIGAGDKPAEEVQGDDSYYPLPFEDDEELPFH